jgi:hypothetical protein
MTECEAVAAGLTVVAAEALLLPPTVPMVGAPTGKVGVAPDPRWVTAQEEAEVEQELELFADWDY